ncbi:hypothetical protein EYF80_052360 [Liparis tanakae]|uniref:Uncharacterized protein n=1 Tax=Liparis tanakae TaxID=230148 RepID=A0A4Z2F8C7_9TELE|nr:hypothetical protein EYF80_052360 [Liparis tanakae]
MQKIIATARTEAAVAPMNSLSVGTRSTPGEGSGGRQLPGEAVRVQDDVIQQRLPGPVGSDRVAGVPRQVPSRDPLPGVTHLVQSVSHEEDGARGAHLPPLHRLPEGLVEGRPRRVDGDGEHGVVRPPQLPVAVQRGVGRVAARQAVQQRVVRQEHHGAVRQAQVVRRLQDTALGLAAQEHRVHAEDHDWDQAGDRRREKGDRRQDSGGRRQEAINKRQETGDDLELTSYFFHLSQLRQSSPDGARRVLREAEESDRQAVTPQGVGHLEGPHTGGPPRVRGEPQKPYKETQIPQEGHQQEATQSEEHHLLSERHLLLEDDHVAEPEDNLSM